MLPPFNKRGVLPKGLHRCTPKEFLCRFCLNDGGAYDKLIPARAAYLPVLEQLFGQSIERGVKTIIVGGSFVTDHPHPNDIDCIVIVPNPDCVPAKFENFIISDCILDLQYMIDDNKVSIYNAMNMFAKDRFELEVGLVEVLLEDGFESSWNDFMSYASLSELLNEREAYINRHVLVGNRKKGVLVIIHGINTDARWDFELAPIVSSHGWIFAPFYHGRDKRWLLDHVLAKKKVDDFRIWINDISTKYGVTPSVIAHSFGTYILGSYISKFNYEPPITFDHIILAGSILNTKFDWITGFKRKCFSSVYNIISPNDPYVPLMQQVKWIRNDTLYGTAGVDGFEQKHPRLFSDKIDIYDHSSMLKVDVFEKKLIPYLNLVTSLSKYNTL